jgi:hypothetical protein
MSRPLEIDFFVAVPTERVGRNIATRTVELGFDTSVEQDEETGEWTCYCTKVLVPTYRNVVAIESQLQALARKLGGWADGFGSYGNAEAEDDP